MLADYATSRVPDRMLTSLLTKSYNVQTLLSLFDIHGSYFNQVHMSAFWTTLGKHSKRNPRQLGYLQMQLVRNATLFERVRTQTTRMIPDLGHREIGNVAHGMASAGIGSAGEWSQLWTTLATSCTERLPYMSEQGLVNVVWAFATSTHAAPPLYAEAHRLLLEKIENLTPQGLANAAWAFATARHDAPSYFVGLEEIIRERGVDAFKPQELCNVIWAYATCGIASEEIFDLAAEYMRENLSDFSPQGIANALWSFATLGHASPALFEAVARASIGRLRSFNQQELSLTAWAYATMAVPAPELFDALAVQATRRVNELNPQAVSNMAWAYATAGHEAPAMFDALTGQLLRNIRSFHPQGIAITTWSLATVGYNASVELQSVIFDEATRRITEFNQQGLSNLAWAAATLNTADRFPTHLYDAIAGQCIEVLDSFNQQGLANLLWSYAKQSVPADNLFRAVIPFVLDSSRKGTLTSLSLVSIMWSYAALGYAPQALFGPLAIVAHKRLDDLSAQGLANLAWSYAVADVAGPEIDSLFGDGAFVERCAIEIGEAQAYSSEGSMANEHLRQLHQWQLWRDERAAEALRRDGPTACVWPSLTEPMRANAAQTFAVLECQPSEFQRQVYEVVCSFCVNPEEEVITSLGYSLDIVARLPTAAVCDIDANDAGFADAAAAAVDLPPCQPLIDDAGVFPGDAATHLVGIEVDGPTHFLYRSRRPSGSTILKRRQLQRAGWRLVAVPYFEWREVSRYKHDREERHENRRRYIAQLLGVPYNLSADELAPAGDRGEKGAV